MRLADMTPEKREQARAANRARNTRYWPTYKDRRIARRDKAAEQAKHLARYDLTVEQKEAMRADQSGRCAICRTEFATLSDACVDHDHVTGAVRALLCDPCNSGLGCF